MKIAIVAPTPVPFGIGGAEKLWWGLLEFINKHTSHQCELIKIPTKENSFWDLIDSYHAFYKLDLSYFDMVITGKYPAWMIEHKNHHIYMLHCLRGFYDCSHFLGLEDEVDSKDQKVTEILNKLKDRKTTIEEIFKLVKNLRNDASIDKRIFDFPGVFIKQLVHFFDQQAMQNIKQFSAISKTVADRKEYFPDQTNVKVIYPPSVLTGFKNTSYDYFFTVSRLDNAKRIQMIIEAYLNSNTQIPLKIAGTGPLLNRFKELIKNDPRIELLGFVSDKDLVEYYSKAYAVLFVPYDEDYGLITVEAMMCEKPVLTFNDTGGVVEFVKNNVTGLVCEPNVNALTKNIDFISSDPEHCKQMGQEAKKRVGNITWENTVNSLLDKPFENTTVPRTKQKQITVVTTYPIYPPRGGGQNRIFYLYKELARSVKVEIVCLTNGNEEYKKTEIAPNLFEIRVPKTKKHAHKEWEIGKQAGIPVTDIAMLYLYNETQLFVDEVKKSCSTSQFAITSHPYAFLLLKESVGIPIIHESHNVEYNLKKQMLKETSHNKKLLDKLFIVEKKACLESKFTMVCAYEDAEVFESIYRFDKRKTIIAPNGVDLESVPYISKEKRLSIKRSMGLDDHNIVLFIGSWHQPNIEAVEEIFKMAVKLPNYNFIVMGSVGSYFAAPNTPKNVGFTGITNDAEKEMYLSSADIALNPMLSGSGTNLKMLDYMANGIPVISTKVGARGLNIPKGYIVECGIDEFTESILNIANTVDIEKNRKYVEETFDWNIIASNLMKDASLI